MLFRKHLQKFIDESIRHSCFIHYTIYTVVYIDLWWYGSGIFSLRSVVCGYEVKKQKPDISVCKHPVILCPEVRCVTCARTPVWLLCSQGSHTLSTMKMTISTSPHPTLPRGSSWKPNMQILPVQTGWVPDIQMMIPLLSSHSFSLWSAHMLYIMYTTAQSSGAGLISGTVSLPPPQPLHTPPHTLFPPSFLAD